MKTFKLIGMALLAIVMSVNFTACSDDDEPGQGENPDTPSIKTKRIKTLVQNHDDGYEKWASTFVFNYDSKGRVSHISEDTDRYTFQWNDDNTITQLDNNEYYGTYSLSNGRIVAFNDGREESFIFSYNEKGQLVSSTQSYLDNDGTVYSKHIMKYIWEEGNLVSSIDDRENSNGKFHLESNFTYDKKMKGCSICYFFENYILYDVFAADRGVPLAMAHPELFGASNANALIKATFDGRDGIEEDTYEYDKSEYPTKVTEEGQSNTYHLSWE